MFPNPVQNMLYVESDVAVRTIQITSLPGLTVLVENPGQLQNGINLSALQPGVYMVKILLENGQTYTQKVLRN